MRHWIADKIWWAGQWLMGYAYTLPTSRTAKVIWWTGRRISNFASLMFKAQILLELKRMLTEKC